MAQVERSPFELLGVAPSATARDIRRAYRRAVVVAHRSRVLDIVAELERLKRAYDLLRDPAARATWSGAAPRPAYGSYVVPRPHELEASVRAGAAREVLRHSLRTGEAALRENEPTVQQLVAEHDRRELAALRKRIFRRRVELALRVVGLGLLILALVWLARG